MPPLRTFPAAPIKTERTHEENQERAYIAASRRSDRSLEARVESARRASDIHKRRTGRSLRVTEQDVLNEEMYEEEDDDLPSQYRRLTAHLQTGSPDFNRRLAAYLTNHVAMRSALDQAITASYAQQFPNAPQFAHNHTTEFPSPFSGQNSPTVPALGSPISPHRYRHSPYPLPVTASHRLNQSDLAASQGNEQEGVRPRTGTSHDTSSADGDPKTGQVLSRTVKSEPETGGKPSPAEYKAIENIGGIGANLGPEHQVPTALSPFTTSLPADTQQLLGPALDPADPFTSSLMSGSNNIHLPKYDVAYYDSKAAAFDISCGMDSTLAPPAPASSQEESSHYSKDAAFAESTSTELGFNAEDFKGESTPTLYGDIGSNATSPGIEGAWDAFIDDSPWAENAS